MGSIARPNATHHLASALIVPLVFAAASFVGGCKKRPAAIEPGSTVRLQYTLTVDDKVVDTSVGRQPLTYVQGSGQIIPGLEEALVGAHVGDKKHVVVPPEKGYGPVLPQAVQKVPKKNFRGMQGLKVGSTVTGAQGNRMIQGKVTAITATDVTVDLNHPMAGKTLNFDVEVLDVAAPAAHATPAPRPT